MDADEKAQFEKLQADYARERRDREAAQTALDAFKEQERARIAKKMESGIAKLKTQLRIEDDSLDGESYDFIRGALMVAAHYDRKPKFRGAVIAEDSNPETADKTRIGMDNIVWKNGRFVNRLTGQPVVTEE